MQQYFQPKIGREIRIFSLGRKKKKKKTTFLEKKSVYEQTYRVTAAIDANYSQAFCPQRKRRKLKHLHLDPCRKITR